MWIFYTADLFLVFYFCYKLISLACFSLPFFGQSKLNGAKEDLNKRLSIGKINFKSEMWYSFLFCFSKFFKGHNKIVSNCLTICLLYLQVTGCVPEQCNTQRVYTIEQFVCQLNRTNFSLYVNFLRIKDIMSPFL